MMTCSVCPTLHVLRDPCSEKFQSFDNETVSSLSLTTIAVNIFGAVMQLHYGLRYSIRKASSKKE